jgi:hypothetical protein
MTAPLYANHNFARPAIESLRRRGYDIVASREISLDRAFDDEQLLYAARSGRVLLTHDIEDYQLLHDAWRRWSVDWGVERQHVGILILPQEWAHERKAGEIDRFLRTSPDLANQLYRWQTSTGWQARSLRTVIT